MANFVGAAFLGEGHGRKQHLRRNSSSSASLSQWPNSLSPKLAQLLAWTTLVLVFTVTLSFLIPTRQAHASALELTSHMQRHHP